MGFKKYTTSEKIEVVVKEKVASVLQKFGVHKPEEVEKEEEKLTDDSI